MSKIHLSSGQMQAALMEGRRQRSAEAHQLFARLWRRLRQPFGQRTPGAASCRGCAA